MAAMAEKKKGKYPWGAVAFGTLGTVMLVRGLFRASRSVTGDAYVTRCPNGSPYVTLEAAEGSTPVYNVTSGDYYYQLNPYGDQTTTALVASSLEPVILHYKMPFPGSTSVTNMGKMAIGTQLAVTPKLEFAVERVIRLADGTITSEFIEPTSWLASRGLSLSRRVQKTSSVGDNWCETGRKLRVPSSVVTPKPQGGGMRLPEPSPYMLLPVSVSTV